MHATALHELLAAVDRAWEELIARTEPTVRRLRIAETNVEIAIAGDELADFLLPGFAWHPAADGPVCATVGAWDAQATGLPLPASLPHPNPRVRQWVARRQGRPIAEFNCSNPEAVSIGNRDTRRHLLGVANVAALDPLDAGAPLRRQLWWALGPDVLFVHAGAVGSADGVALIMGASGAGKSSTSLACLRAGMGFLSDDYCLVRGGPPVAHLLTTTARVHHHELPHLGDLAASDDGEPRAEKALLRLHRSVPERLVSSAPVRVLLVPELADERMPRLVPMRPSEVLRAVAPAALWQMHVDAQRELAGLGKLVSAVPAYRLLLSRRRDANPVAIQECLAGAASRSA